MVFIERTKFKEITTMDIKYSIKCNFRVSRLK